MIVGEKKIDEKCDLLVVGDCGVRDILFSKQALLLEYSPPQIFLPVHSSPLPKSIKGSGTLFNNWDLWGSMLHHLCIKVAIVYLPLAFKGMLCTKTSPICFLSESKYSKMCRFWTENYLLMSFSIYFTVIFSRPTQKPVSKTIPSTHKLNIKMNYGIVSAV